MTETNTPFSFDQEEKVSVLVLKPELNQVQWGEIDSIGTQVLNSMTSDTQPNMIVDLSHMTYMGSAMVALIVRVWKAILAKKGQLAVVCPHEGVKDVFRLASLDKHWKIVPTIEEARQLLGSGKAVAAVHVPPSNEPRPNWLKLIGMPLGLLLFIAAVTYAINPELFVGKKLPNLDRNSGEETEQEAAETKPTPAAPAATTSEFEEVMPPAESEKPAASQPESKPAVTDANPYKAEKDPSGKVTTPAVSPAAEPATEESAPKADSVKEAADNSPAPSTAAESEEAVE